MFKTPAIDVIIPAYNEEVAVGRVVEGISKSLVREIIVCDNNSSDRTAIVARNAGATVIFEEEQGYGSACLRGLEYISRKSDQPDIVVFIDGNFSERPEEIPAVIQPILEDKADLVIGSRVLGKTEDGAMKPQQVFGNKLATFLIRLFFKARFTDLSPFRAISWSKLRLLDMQDRTYGWTVEMQVKAAKMGLRYLEVPVNYRRRLGQTRLSKPPHGSVSAGQNILWTIFKLI